MDQQREHSLFDLHMDARAQSSLLSVSKWTRFIAVTGIIIGAIALLLALAYGAQIIQAVISLFSIADNLEESGMLIAILVVAILLGSAWLYFLLKTSSLLNRGLEARNSALLAEGFRAMRVYFIISFIISLLSIFSVFTDII